MVRMWNHFFAIPEYFHSIFILNTKYVVILKVNRTSNTSLGKQAALYGSGGGAVMLIDLFIN